MPRFVFVLALAMGAPGALAQSFSSFALPELPVSPHEASVAQALAASSSDNPYVLRHNPAFLADAGERPSFRLGASVAPEVFGSDDLLIRSAAGSVGVHAGEVGGGALRIGLGGGYSEYSASSVRITNPGNTGFELYDTQEYEVSGGLALGWDGPVHVRAGAGVFSRQSLEMPVDLGAPSASLLDRDRSTTLDVGAAVSYPLLRGPREPDTSGPEVEVMGALVYRSAATISEDIFERIFPDPRSSSGTRGSPPPTELVAGVGVRAALVRTVGRRGEFRIVEADVRAQSHALDALADEYRLGATVVVAEILGLRAGVSRVDLRDQDARASLGAELRLGGIVRAVGVVQEKPALLALSDRMTARLEAALLNVGEELGETVYVGLVLGRRPSL